MEPRPWKKVTPWWNCTATLPNEAIPPAPMEQFQPITSCMKPWKSPTDLPAGLRPASIHFITKMVLGYRFDYRARTSGGKGMRKTIVASCCLAVALAWVITARAEEPTAQWNALVDEFLDKVYFPLNPTTATLDGVHNYDSEIE